VKAAVLRETGGPPVFADFDEPVAGEGQVVVEMAAAAIHHVDLARASGSFLGPPPLPSVLGNDGVGRLPDGRRVFVDSAVVPFGTWSERALAGTDSLLDVADGVDDATAAALANTGLTAWLARWWRAPVQPGQTVLVLGSAGAVGTVAVQAARVLGAGRVIAAVREGERPPPGADAVVRLTPGADWAAGFRDASGGRGVDIIIDPLWGGRPWPLSGPPLRVRGWCRSAPWPARRCSCRRRSCGPTRSTSSGMPCSARRSRSGGTPTGS
jgi:NADPH2:quinone reductase